MFTIVYVSLMNIAFKLLLQLPADLIKKDNNGQTIKRVIGGVLACIYLGFSIYMTCVILAHFNLETRNTWIFGFFRSYILDNIINQVIMTTIQCIIGVFLFKEEENQSKFKEAVLKLLKDEVKQLLRRN